MKSWRGLLRKEWMMLRRSVTILAILSILIVLVGPSVVGQLFDVPGEYAAHAFILGGTWIGFQLFLGVSILFMSLGNELKRPDIWLHSPISMYGLTGAKVAFAAIVTAGSMVWSGMLLGIAFILSGEGGSISFENGVLPLLNTICALFLRSLFIMGVGFFFWSVYQVLRSRYGSFLSTIMTYIVLALSMVVWEKLRVTGIFEPLKTFMPVKWTDVDFYQESHSYFLAGLIPGSVIFSVGGLLLYGAVTVASFMAGSVLFEKKVRL
ncbi:hypothetical protein AB1K83_08510 [Sporosarcina sp. 179-K 3D1 HS]|uniref:hypothetical protein n=1 Tax=Sporosarcina sp. 179-K 3D1 HS TaxID=3232169 RepID=UPI0039A30CAB